MEHMFFQYNEEPRLRSKNLWKSRPTDSGWDIRSNQEVTLFANDWLVLHTGLHVHIPLGLTGLIKSRSSLAVNHHVECSNAGVIDHGFTGEVVIKLYNWSQYDYKIQFGMRIAQLILVPSFCTDLSSLCRYEFPTQVPELDLRDWPVYERGSRGLGSTDKEV
jgi:deoxyuridine 5'-triphosphate nucleotidohydrolase